MADYDQAWTCTPAKMACLSPSSELFQQLALRDKLYAHYTARAAWRGAKIILRQVSPEAPGIFDFIIELFHSCNRGDWYSLCDRVELSLDDLEKFLEFSAIFLGNIGNYYGHGDHKFIPSVSRDVFEKLAAVSGTASDLWDAIKDHVFATQPSVLGLTSSNAQSMYYDVPSMTKQQICRITDMLGERGIQAENTRMQQTCYDGVVVCDVLQASVELAEASTTFDDIEEKQIRLVKGDYSQELQDICSLLRQAQEHCDDPTRQSYISHLCDSFTTGDMETYKQSQRAWVHDESPQVETVFGFVEPYRDPCGVRAEFEGIVGIVHPKETELLARLIEHQDSVVEKLPWVPDHDILHGNGPFEMPKMEHRNFISLHTIAYCSSLIFPGINLPNYNDIRQEVGFKNIMFTNSIDGSAMAGDSPTVTVPDEELATYLDVRPQTYYLWVVFHELYGHGTGKLLSETQAGVFNFDSDNPPFDPITGKAIDSWYKPGQTWTSVFGDIATTVDECRAECVGAYLMSDPEILAVCGYSDQTDLSPLDLEYNMYQQLAIAGIRSLENYTPMEGWSQSHSQGHFAMFQAIRRAGDDFIRVRLDTSQQRLVTQVDRSKISSVGRPALRQLLLQLHVYRCTADVNRCRIFYNQLTNVTAECLEWRQILLASPPVKRVFVQPNTFLMGGDVTLKQYEPTAEGMIQSWAERMEALSHPDCS